jgi:hypothetical protein
MVVFPTVLLLHFMVVFPIVLLLHFMVVFSIVLLLLLRRITSLMVGVVSRSQWDRFAPQAVVAKSGMAKARHVVVEASETMRAPDGPHHTINRKIK